MNPRTSRSWTKVRQGIVAASCAAMLLPGDYMLFAQSATPAPTPSTAPADPAAATEPAEAKLPPDKLDSLVAPIALYPDNLLAQALVASTYPLEIVQLQQWLVKNKDLKGSALTDAAAKQPWDPAIQSMATIPDLVKRLADDIQWATELGNAFLAQQSEVMDAVQRMRKKAQEKGALTTNEQQKVETQVIEEKTIIVVEQADPEVVYVPSYNPTVVYGPPPVYYSYPPVYYPPYTPGAAFVSFSIGVAVGAAFWGGGCGWGHNEINIDVDRNVNRNTNRNVDRSGGGAGNRTGANASSRSGGGGSTWSHDSSHRGAAPYSNKSTANKFSGSTRAQSGTGARSTAATQSSLGASNRSGGAGSRSGGAGPSATSRSGGGAGGGSRSSTGGNSIGGRSMPQSSAPRSSGFSGGSSGFSGSSTRASSSRGSRSMGGGGGGRGGGGRR